MVSSLLTEVTVIAEYISKVKDNISKESNKDINGDGLTMVVKSVVSSINNL